MTPRAPRNEVGATFATRLADRDRAAFAGRQRELTMIESLAPDDAPLSVLLMHGPEAIGKSA